MFSALILELVGAVIYLFSSTEFFAEPSSEGIIVRNELPTDMQQLKSSIVSADNFIGETMDDHWLSGDVLEQQLSVVNIPSSFQSSPALLSQSELSSHQAKKDFKRKEGVFEKNTHAQPAKFVLGVFKGKL